MTLLDYISDNVLIANTYDIFDYDTLKLRFVASYGGFNVRHDLTAAQIASYAQNVIDTNKDYYKSLFAHSLDPYKTWGESGTNNNTTTNDTTTTDTTDYTTKTTGDNTTNSGGDSSTTDSSNVYRNAYNTPQTATPTENTTGSTTSQYGDTTKTTLDTTVTNGGTRTTTNGGTIANDGSTQKSGWTNADALSTMRNYKAAYDIIIDDIAAVIIDMFINIWG